VIGRREDRRTWRLQVEGVANRHVREDVEVVRGVQGRAVRPPERDLAVVERARDIRPLAGVGVREEPLVDEELVPEHGADAVGYLVDHPAPRSIADLLDGHALIGKDRDTSFFTRLATSGLALKRKDFALRTDNDAAYLAALRAGVGIGICQVPLAEGPPRLRRLLPKASFELPVWVVTHEDLRASRRVSIVFDHLVASLGKYIQSS
jgi:hypothetical protein